MVASKRWRISTYKGADGKWRISWARGRPYEDEEKALEMLRRAIESIEETRKEESETTGSTH